RGFPEIVNVPTPGVTVSPAGTEERTCSVRSATGSSGSETETFTVVIGSLYCTVCDNRLIVNVGLSFTALTVTSTDAVAVPPCPSSIVYVNESLPKKFDAGA